MTERQEELQDVQEKLQRLWDKIEAYESVNSPTYALWREFKELETLERSLLHLGTKRAAE